MSDINTYISMLKHFDPDFRMNAVRSLSEFYLNDNLRNSMTQDDKNKLIDGLLEKLETKESEEVKTITIRIFGRIAKFLKDSEIIKIFEKIIGYITDLKTVGRDIYVICAKSIFKELTGNACSLIGNVILPVIISGIKNSHNEIKEISFDIFNEYINTFNYILIKGTNNILGNKEQICDIVVDSLKIDIDSLRKTLSKFMGNFSMLLTDNEVNNLIKKILNIIETSELFDHKIVYMIALNSIGKATASKNSYLIENVLPLIFRFANESFLYENMVDYDQANELAEASLNILETYILKNSSSLKGNIDDIIQTCLCLIQYDPNFSYENIDDDMQLEYDTEDAYAYVDDSSWKVRRASTRVFSAITKSRMEVVNSLINSIVEKLVFCLREHEENTKDDIISCLGGYLRNLTVDDTSVSQMHEFGLVRQKSIAQDIVKIIFDGLLENIKKLISSTNNNVLTGGLNLLCSLALPAPKEIIGDLDKLTHNLNDILKKNSSNFNLLIFNFFNRLLKSVSYDENIVPHLDTIIDWMIYGLKNDYYKINIESSNMASQIIRILSECLAEEEIFPKLQKINKEIIPKFISNDLDQELKLSIITTAGNILLYLGHCVDEETLSKFFEIFLDKFKNENLVILCVSWIIKILKIDRKMTLLVNSLKKFIPTIIELINKKNTTLRQSAVEFLCCIIEYYPDSVKGYEKKIIENLLEYSNDESFIYILFETISLFIKKFQLEKNLILLTIKESSKIIDDQKIILSEKAAESLLLYNSIASNHLSAEELENLIKGLLNYSTLNQNKSKLIAYYSINANNHQNLMKNLVKDLTSKIDNETKKNILLLLGDIALASSYESTAKEIFELIQKIFQDSNDEIKANAAVTLAKVGFSNPSEFLSLVKFLKNPSSMRYALSSLREFIHLICNRNIPLNLSNEIIIELFNILVKEIDCNDEKISKLCGECLGLLSGKSKELLEKYLVYLDDDNDNIRSGFYYGLKSLDFNKDENVANIILNKLIKGLSDNSISVKQNSYNSLISYAHDYSHIFKLKFNEIWIHFEEDYMIKVNLIDTVDIGGGMRIRNDKGLPIRKAIFSIIKILIDTIPEKIHFVSALQILMKGLDDEDDVATISFGSIIKISQLAPGSILAFVDNLIDILKKIYEVLKKSSNDKNADKKKYSFVVISCQRLFNEMKKIQEIEENLKFIDFNNEIQAVNIN